MRKGDRISARVRGTRIERKRAQVRMIFDGEMKRGNVVEEFEWMSEINEEI